MNNITIIPIKNLPEFSPKHDLADELIKGFENNNLALEDNDVIVVTQKIVSKVENRLIESNFENIEELIEKESLEILRKRGDTIIARTKHGFICANAGIDKSNIKKVLFYYCLKIRIRHLETFKRKLNTTQIKKSA